MVSALLINVHFDYNIEGLWSMETARGACMDSDKPGL